jgi:hypothetical protein
MQEKIDLYAGNISSFICCLALHSYSCTEASSQIFTIPTTAFRGLRVAANSGNKSRVIFFEPG